MLVFKFNKQMTKEQVQERIFNRHLRYQQNINVAFTKQSNLSK